MTVIGINSYPAPLPVLVTAVGDARAVAAVLSASYGFHVTLLDHPSLSVEDMTQIQQLLVHYQAAINGRDLKR